MTSKQANLEARGQRVSLDHYGDGLRRHPGADVAMTIMEGNNAPLVMPLASSQARRLLTGQLSSVPPNRATTLPVLKLAGSVWRAQAYRRNIYKELDRVKDLLIL